MTTSSAVARRALLASPFPGRGLGRALPRSAMLASSALLARNAHHVLLNKSSALLIPVRAISTNPNTHRPDARAPPPGFNPEMAKIPLAKDAPSKAPSANQSAAAAPAKPSAGIPATAAKAQETPEQASPGTEDHGTPPMQLTTPKETAPVEKEEDKALEQKETIKQKIKHALRHYWDGSKLLATEVKISSRLALKMAAGYELTRREHRQLRRTVQDLGRLVPFSVFVIVPFAELLLPVALRLFPNLLPSTFEGQKTKEEKAAALRATRKDVSDLLRETLVETGLPLTLKAAAAHKGEFSAFFRKVRATGERPTAADVIRMCTLFRDDLTLDNLSRAQLVSMCRYLNLNGFGTDNMLRYLVRHRMRQIKHDDRAIADEGVDDLSVAELQAACQARGIRTHGTSPARLRDDLQVWLDLRLRHKVPSTLLVLANAFKYNQPREGPGDGLATQIDALTGVLSSIPEELYHEMELQVHEDEGAATNRQRLEVLKEQEELIQGELTQNKESADTGFAYPSDKEDIDDRDDSAAAAASKDAPAAADKDASGAAAASPDAAPAAEGGDKDGREAPREASPSPAPAPKKGE